MRNQKCQVNAFVMLSILIINLICFPHLIHATESLPSGLVIGDDQGFYATSTGEYYIDLADVHPGDHYRKEITIRSLDLEEPFDLGLLVSKKSSTGSLDWNQHVTVRLLLDDKQIYEGPLLGDGSFDWAITPLTIGRCTFGTDKILVAEFEVDPKLTTNELLDSSELIFQWTFVAVKEPSLPSTDSSEESIPPITSTANSSGKQLPKTGERVAQRMIQVIGIILLLIVLLLWKKQQNERR